jgi:hypothetical protein
VLTACSSGRRPASSTSVSSSTFPTDIQVAVPDAQLLRGHAFDREKWILQWTTTPGSPAPRCVDVAGHTDVRSGQFVAGNFVSFVSGWNGTYETSKLYYIPLHPATGVPLVLTARLVRNESSTPSSTTADVVTLRFGDGFAWSTTGQPFYVTGTVLPSAGRWVVQVSAGSDRGCFVVQVGRNLGG